MAATTTRRGNSRRVNAMRPRAGAPAARTTPGSLTIEGLPENVAKARAFVAEVLGPDHPCADVAVLLCSELVTNAVLHSNSRRHGGGVTVVVADLAESVQVEVIDEGSASSIPVVKADVYVAEGHGLFLVENLADQWGYESEDAGTTVWFRLTPGTAQR
jgi:anti-sigma regulatory factor (Ser/Thr protein kinase)